MKVADVGGAFKGSFLICVIERNHEIIIPSGDVVLKKGDNISVIMPLAAVSYTHLDVYKRQVIGLLSFKEEDKFYTFSRAGSLMCGIFAIFMVAVLMMGIV